MDLDFIALSQECRSADELELRLLEQVGRKVGFDAAFFLVRGNEQAATILGLDDRTTSLARERGAAYGRELMPVKRAALRARGVAVDTDVLGTAGVRRTRYHRELAITVRGEHTLAAYLRFRGQVVAGMMLGRGGAGFSADEVRVVESWLPALAVARAAHGLPWVPEALSAPASSRLAAFGWPGRPRVLETLRTAWGSVVVRDRAGFREMVALHDGAELVWSRISLEDSWRSGWPYVDLLQLAPVLARTKRRALCVGCGGGACVRQLASLFRGIVIDVVESEPEVIGLARRWFDLGGVPGVAVHVDEGGGFVRRAAPATWDVIVIDAYGPAGFSSDLASSAFLAAARRALRPGGVLACNLIGTLRPWDFVVRFGETARSVFDDVRIVPVMVPGETFSQEILRNVVVIAVRAK